MNIYRIIKSAAYDVYDVYDMVNEERQKLIHEFHSDKRKLPDAKKNMNWDVIKLQEIKPILQQYVRDGFVRNEKAVDRITEKILRNLAKLQASTELAGHTEISTDEYFEDEGFEPPSNKAYHEQTEEESERSMDFYFNFLETEHGTPISDYGLKPLWELAEQLMAVSTAEEQIQYIDQMLQITHRRGDLASLFIEGGTASLDDLFGDMTNLHAMSNFPITTAQEDEDEDEENPILSDLIDEDKWIQKNYLFLFENPPYIIDTDNQLQQFELSLNDQFIASRDTMEDAMNAALEHYEGYLEPEIQEEVTPYQIIDSQYGYTDSLERAGYIMEDGRLVNLNRPHIDHRAVTVDGTTKSMQEFIADGNIRMSYSNGYAYITMFNKPTAAQKGKLLELFDNATNGVDVNLDKELGDYNPHRETYDGGENKINEHFSTSSKEAILGKIMSYYSDTKIYPSQFAKFMKEKDDWNWYKKAEIKSYGLKEFRR